MSGDADDLLTPAERLYVNTMRFIRDNPHMSAMATGMERSLQSQIVAERDFEFNTGHRYVKNDVTVYRDEYYRITGERNPLGNRKERRAAAAKRRHK